MAAVKKRKKSGSVAYAVFILLWIAVLAFGIVFVLKALSRFEQYWEDSQISPVIEEYMASHSTGLVDAGLTEKVRQMDHPFQTEEECLRYVEQDFMEDLNYKRASGKQADGQTTFDVYCGQKIIGQVMLAQRAFVPDDLPIIQKYVEQLSLYPWEVVGDNFEFNVDELADSIRVTAPEEYTVLINDIPVSEDYIVETGIPYDVLEPYYEDYPDLPTKVTYEVGGLFGSVNVSYLDGRGNPATIDPNLDDSQFVEAVTGEMYDRLYTFAYEFSSRYLEFSSGTTDMSWLYGQLHGFIKPGSELDTRLLQAMEGYEGWQHNSRFRFETATMHNVIPLAGDFFVLEVTAKANCIQPIGTVEIERNLRIFVRYLAEDDDVLAFSCEDY